MNATFELVEIRLGQVVGVRLRRHFFYVEVLAGEVEGFAQLVNHDRRRASSDVNTFEVVAEVFEHEHLFAHVFEIRGCDFFFEWVSIEAAVWAQSFAERYMHVEHVPLVWLCFWHCGIVGDVQSKVLLRHGFDDGS